eukprot:2949772-Pyramimonas_sp.AAC.1
MTTREIRPRGRRCAVLLGAAGRPNTGAQDAAIASRSAIGRPQCARAKSHSGEGSLLRLVDKWESPPPPGLPAKPRPIRYFKPAARKSTDGSVV